VIRSKLSGLSLAFENNQETKSKLRPKTGRIRKKENFMTGKKEIKG
jgi:hypothetical protein